MPHPGFFESIGRSLSGPGMFGGRFQLRLIVQPILAVALGIRFGLRDARQRRPPVGAALRAHETSRARVLEQWTRGALVALCAAFVVDAILQILINHWFRPLAAVVVALLLVFVPFTVVRAATNRIWTHGHPGAGQAAQRP
jgi:hypothetical protein